MSNLLSVKALRKSFSEGGKEIHVLRDVNFDLAEGERLAVVGESGVGKSTLLHILGTLDRPTGGRYFLAASSCRSTMRPHSASFATGKSALFFSFIISYLIFQPWKTLCFRH